MRADNPLHRARLDRGIGLTELAGHTALSPRILQTIDAGRFEELPAGIYARSYVRAFACAVGLEPEQAVRELSDRLPAAEDPLPAMRETGACTPPAWMVLVTAWTCGTTAWLATAGTEPAAWRQRLSPCAKRLAARGLDAGVLFLLFVLLAYLTAWTSGVGAWTVLEHAGAGVAALWVVLVCLYFGLLGGIGGRTPGAWLFGLPLHAGTDPLRLRSILDRALQS